MFSHRAKPPSSRSRFPCLRNNESSDCLRPSLYHATTEKLIINVRDNRRCAAEAKFEVTRLIMRELRMKPGVKLQFDQSVATGLLSSTLYGSKTVCYCPSAARAAAVS